MDKNTTPVAIGKRVAAGRKKAGYSRNRFALRLKIPYTNFRDRELGHRDFDLSQLRLIAEALDLEFEFWLRDLPAQTELAA